MSTRSALSSLVAVASFASLAAASGVLVTVPPNSYRSVADSALFGVMSLDDEFRCETFEDGLVNTLGLSVGGGSIVAPSPTTDSVDSDDGSLDGSGTGGRCYRVAAGGTATISFASGPLGGFPERCGFAWTDGGQGSTLTLTITTGTGAIVTRTAGPLGDGADDGATAEDRLVAISHSDGIQSIAVVATGGGFEFDHVQYEDPAVADASQWNQHDFSDDGKDDILWFNPSTRTASTWIMDGLVRAGGGSIAVPVPPTWVYVGVGATDDTGKAFVFWRDAATGLMHVWKLSGNEIEPEGLIENTGPVGPEWQVVAIADLDGDVDADLVFRNAATGLVNVWLLDNHSRVGGGLVGGSGAMEFLGCADLNGDRRDDLLWRDGSGVVKSWMMNGLGAWTTGTIAGAGAVPATWSLTGIADLDGDGCDDLLWRQQGTGLVTGWRMLGMAKAGQGIVAAGVPAAWTIEGVADLNDDGREDLLWKHGMVHQVNGWLMDGLVKSAGGLVGGSGPAWSVCNR